VKKKIIIGAVIFTVFGAIYIRKNLVGKSNPQIKDSTMSVRVIDVDEVIKTPEKYQDFFGVEGRVIKVEKSRKLFLLGCDDACIFMPVKYQRGMPQVNDKIIVYGKVEKQADGRYVFNGEKVEENEE